MTRTYKFKPGDPVTALRPKDSRGKELIRKNGIVLQRTADYSSQFGPYPELYTVLWDDGKQEHHLLPHGLSKGD